MVVVLDPVALESLAALAIRNHKEKVALARETMSKWMLRSMPKTPPSLWWYSEHLAADAKQVRRILRELLGLHRGPHGRSKRRPGLRVLAKPDGLYFFWRAATGREGRLRVPVQRAIIGDACLLDAAA